MSAAIEQVLSGLRGVRKSGDGWVAFCPGHDDRHHPSLSIDVADDGTLLFKCFTGCEQSHLIDRISATVGMDPREFFGATIGARHSNGYHPTVKTEEPGQRLPPPWPGLTLEDYAAAKRLDPVWLRTRGLSDTRYVGKPAVRISYCDEAGQESAARFRVAMDKGEDYDRFKWQKSATLGLYGLDWLDVARQRGVRGTA